MTAEVSGRARASVSAEILGGLWQQAATALGSKTSVTATVDGRYAVYAAAGWAQTAYLDTVDSYLCFMKEKALKEGKVDYAKQIDLAGREIRAVLNEFYDPFVWQISPDGRAARREINQSLITGEGLIATQSIPLPKSFVTLPDYNFDRVQINQVTADATFGPIASVAGCAGLVQRSIKKISPEVLDGLQKVDTTITTWLTSTDKRDAMQDIWDFVAPGMNQTLTLASATESVSITPQFLTCLDTAHKAALSAEGPAR